MKTAIIILLSAAFSFAATFTVKNTYNKSTAIDSLVESFAKYFDQPMSFCKVVPAGIEVIESSTAHSRVLITANMSCDNTESQFFYQSSIRSAIGNFSWKTRQWDGLIGSDDMRNEFIRKMNRRYPWFSMKWNYKYGCLYVIPKDDYVGTSYVGTGKINPIWFKVLLNGKVLRDARVHKYGGNAIDSIVRVDAIHMPAEITLLPPEGHRELGNYESATYVIDFLVDTDYAKKISGTDVDIKFKRIFKFQTKGYFNNPYRFPIAM